MRFPLRGLSTLAPLLIIAAPATAQEAPSTPTDGSQIEQPGYYRFHLGTFEIIALNDGTLAVPAGDWLSIGPERTRTKLEQPNTPDAYVISDNSYLINTGSKLILVDAGGGDNFGTSLGRLVRNLEAAGYRPEQIDEIYITHMHGDHVGGLVKSGRLVFPNAIVRAEEPEAGYWLDAKQEAAAPALIKGFFKGAAAGIKPVMEAGRFKPFTGRTQLQPGITAVPLHGHTPGHTGYLVESQGQKLLLIGDLIHVAEVQFPDPSVTIAVDTDQPQAKATRLTEFKDLIGASTVVGGAHISFPGLGRIRRDGTGYRWAPVTYLSRP